MNKHRRVKTGDTLVEVMLAIGIFSMVAISVVSVINGSTSSVQSTLETTITREEINTQAEALRFLRSSFNDSSAPDYERYKSIWQAIADRAVNLDTVSDKIKQGIINYNPSSCSNLYNVSGCENGECIFAQKAFILNPRKLGTGTANDVVKTPSTTSANIFFETGTYPRLVYNGATDNLLDKSSGTDLWRAEGIFIVAVKDASRTVIVSPSGSISKQPVFYDFYIRTCWTPPNAKRPSTISTVIRLYDPNL